MHQQYSKEYRIHHNDYTCLSQCADHTKTVWANSKSGGVKVRETQAGGAGSGRHAHMKVKTHTLTVDIGKRE